MDDVKSSDKIRQQTVVAQVMGEIRELIASNAYAAGDKIPTEKELAERFGVGRSSIREAIKIFTYLGVLESRAALGTFVRDRSQISSEALSWSLLLGNDELERTYTEYDLVNALSRVVTHNKSLAPRYRRQLSLAAGTLAQRHIRQCPTCGTWLSENIHLAVEPALAG